MGHPLQIHIWTDGGMYKSNPGPGGWAAVLTFNGQAKVIGGCTPATTNNAMETEAVAGALNALKRPCQVVIHTDSEYVRKGLNKILRYGKTHETNVEVWQRVQAALKRHNVSIVWTKGHAGDPYNILADAYAGYCAEHQATLDEYLDNLDTALAERRTKKRIKKLKDAEEKNGDGNLSQTASDS